MQVVVTYHHEGEGWWADSSDLAGFTVVGNSMAEVRALVHEGLPVYLESDDIDLYEVLGSYTPVVEVELGASEPQAYLSTGATSTGGATEISRQGAVLVA